MRGYVHVHKREGRRIVARRVVIELGIDAEGTRRRWTEVVRGSEEEAEAILTRKMDELLRGVFVPRTALTVKVWLEDWLETYAPKKAGAGAVETYRRICEKHITPALGSLKLSEVTPEAVELFYTAQGKKGLTGRTVLSHHRVLGAAMKRAVRVGKIATNPMDRVDPPRIGDVCEPMAIDAAETVDLLAKLDGGELYMPAVLAVRTGLRRGEVLALRWSDVNLDACRLRVERACDPSKANRGGYKVPKSKHSRRTISFTADVQAVLRAQRRTQNERRLRLGIAYQAHGLVVSRNDGAPWDPSRFSNAWTKAKKEHSFEVSFHELRHSYASQLAGLGVPLGTVQALMGHADPMTTQRVYTHTLAGQLEDAAARQEAALRAAAAQAKAVGV